MRKLLLAVAATVGLAAMVHADCDSRVQTCFSAVDVSGALSVGSMTNSGATTMGGVFNTATTTPYAVKFSSKTAAIPTGTPSATGILAVDNSNILYISTSTNAGGWQKVGAQ